MGYGERIKQLRLQNQMTQSDLAKKLDCTDGAIRGWESERREMDFSTLNKMAKIFNVTTDYILGTDEHSNKNNGENMGNNILGENIRRLRIKNKMTQNDLSKKMNKAESTIGMWEQGRRELDYDSLKDLASLFDVSIDFLLGRVTSKDDRKGDNDIVLDDFEFALYGEVKELTEAQKQDLLDMIKIIKRRKD